MANREFSNFICKVRDYIPYVKKKKVDSISMREINSRSLPSTEKMWKIYFSDDKIENIHVDE